MSDISYLKILGRLVKYIKKYFVIMIFALLFMFAMSVMESLIPLVARNIIDKFTQNQTFPNTGIIIGYFILFILQAIFSYIGNYLFNLVSFKVVKDIRIDAFKNLQYLNMRYFDNTPSGTIVSRVTNDTEAISVMFSSILSNFLRAIFIFSTTLVTMIWLDISLTLSVIILIPLIIFFVNLYRKKSTIVAIKMREKIGEINGKLAEYIEAMNIIQIFRQEKRLQEDFAKTNDEHVYYATKFIAVDSLLLRPMMSLLKLIGYAILLLYFGISFTFISLTAGSMYAFIQYVGKLFDPIIQVTQNLSNLQTSLVSAHRVFELIDLQAYEPEQQNGLHKISIGNIEFKNVGFSYDGNIPVLKNISFKVNQGETIAFVGHTGSGKSSIVNVFMRFYEFQQGEVLIDGVDIRQYSYNELRKQVGLVLQEPFIYEGTIKSNIQMYQNLTDEEIKNAAQFVDAEQFIENLPNRYDERVSYRGTTISYGQRQLLAFARTIATNPKILILDEATASVDSQTEEIIQNSLKKMRKGRTTIAIAHRLSTIQDANCIYVLDKGEIIESGTHEELIQKKGQYYKMYQLQMKQNS